MTSSTRARLLTLFLTHPSEEYYLREVQRRSGQSLRGVQVELARLERLGLVSARRRGRQRFYRANTEHPLYDDLKRIVYKTAALGDVLRQALREVPGIRAAFVYGSVAKGREVPASDVDLFVLGEPSVEQLHQAVSEAERVLNREVSVTTMRPGEWRERRARRDGFVAELLKSQKIFLVGHERSLRAS